MADPKNFREFVESVSPAWLLGELSGAFEGIVLGFMADAAGEGMSLAVKIAWLKEPTSPDDVLVLVGAERALPRYPIETAAQYRARLWDAWNAYKFGGDEESIIGQFALAGFAGVQIFDASEIVIEPLLDMNSNPWWSQFIVYFPEGTHPITAEGPPWGSFNWGDGTRLGPVGLTIDVAIAIRGIIEKWKPVRWICRKIIFQIEGWIYGGGHTWGEAGLNWGGTTAVMST